MTATEYKDKILNEICNASSVEDVKDIINKADNVVNNSDISNLSKNKFWIDLNNDLLKESISLEEQAGSSLSAIISAAKAIIASKISTSIQSKA